MANRAAAPTDTIGFAPRNWLLAALPRKDLLSLRPHLEPMLLARGSVLLDADEPLTHVYFVETGVAFLVAVLENRATAGVAMIGREGFIGIASLLGGDTGLGRHVVGVPGSALSLEVSLFRSVVRQSPRLRAACEAYARAFFAQTLQAVACSRLHTVEERCARWLLMCDDRTEGDTLEPTPECLAEVLGVRRATVIGIAGKLQRTGLICYRRGAITVLDRRGLEGAACECYRILRDRFERQLAHAVG